MDIDAFWSRVKILIKAHNVDQKKFAAHIGIPLDTLKGWIYHKRIPDVGTAYDIAAALGVSLDYLVFGKENDTTEQDKKKRSSVKEAAVRVQDDMALINSYF